MLRLQPELLEWVDAEQAKIEPEPSQREMIRAILARLRPE